MKVVAILAFIACASALWTGKFKPVGGKIEGQYICVFKQDAQDWERNVHLAKVSQNITIIAQHDIGTFHGYSAQISTEFVEAVQASEELSYCVQDGIATVTQADCDTQTGLPAGLWGLYRIANRDLPIGNVYHFYDTTETTVRSYILDTGILVTHNDFEGRAIYGANFVDAVQPDQHGHGSHVASTVGGTQYGVNKGTTLVAVKVLGKNGSGSWTGVIQGVQWATTDANKYRGTSPGVGNMSLGGGRNQAVNDAVTASTQQGFAWVIASGNSNADACNFSPASSDGALAVGASSNTDARATFSNWGRCQKIWAPGVNVLGAWWNSNTATNTISGTSMAAPHACGVVVNYLATQPATPPITPEAAFRAVIAAGTPNKITDGKEAQGTPNVLAYSRCS
jgi:serine protease